MRPLVSYVRTPFLLALGALLTLTACDCAGPKINALVQKCTSDEWCANNPNAPALNDPPFHEAGGSNAYCDLSDGKCKQEDWECDPEQTPSDPQCCPGQVCAALAELCTDKYVKCDEASDCTVEGQVCRPLGTPPGDPGCTFEECGSDGSCPDGLGCFNGYCVGELPCNGGCKSGSVCTPVNNRCYEVDDTLPASCQQACGEGTMLVFVDGHNVFNRCDRKKRDCTCEPLPPIGSQDMARHSSAALAGDKILVSAYDADHGDLVVHTFAKDSLERLGTEWVDGVPTSGAIVGDIRGPRGGRAEPGIDVGLYTSIAYDAGSQLVHVSYYAAKDGSKPLGDLRYARRGTDGAWSIHTVDGRNAAGESTGDVGLYSKITVAPDGAPVIVYFQKSGVGSIADQTAVKIARATKREPVSAADWKIAVIEGGLRTPAPCSSAPCASGQECTEGGVCRAKISDSSCAPACKSGEICALGTSDEGECFPRLVASTLADLPEGNGLWPSIAYLDTKPVVVWFDRTNGVLKGAIARADSASAGAGFDPGDIKVLDNGANVGQFTSIAVGPSQVDRRIAVAYFDAGRRQLRLLAAKDGWQDVTPPEARTVDKGLGDPDTDPLLFVGADASVRFDSLNRLVVAYQDTTRGDLRLARQQVGASQFELTTLVEEGAAGFYANLLVDGANTLVTHATIKAVSASRSSNRLQVMRAP